MNYVVSGNYEICGKIQECLIKVCATEEQAIEEVNKLKLNPPQDCLGNIRYTEQKTKDCWWNY